MLSFQPLFAPSLWWQISNKLSTTCKKPADVKRHTSHKVLRTSVPRLEQPCSKSGTHIDKAVTSCKQLVPSKLVLHAQPFVNVFKYILYIAHARLYVICLERRALIRSSCHINKPQFYARRSPSQRKVENALPRSYNLVHNSARLSVTSLQISGNKSVYELSTCCLSSHCSLLVCGDKFRTSCQQLVRSLTTLSVTLLTRFFARVCLVWNSLVASLEPISTRLLQVANSLFQASSFYMHNLL